jgi:hypothetical protein
MGLQDGAGYGDDRQSRADWGMSGRRGSGGGNSFAPRSMFLVQQAQFAQREGEVGAHGGVIGALSEILAQTGHRSIEAPTVRNRARKLLVVRQRLLRDRKGDGKKRHHRFRPFRLQKRGGEPRGGKHVMRVQLNDARERAFGGFAVADGARNKAKAIMHLGVIGILRRGLDEDGEFAAEKLVNIRAGGGPRRQILTERPLAQTRGNIGGEVRPGQHPEQQIAEIRQRDERLRRFRRLPPGNTGIGDNHARVGGQKRVDECAGLLEKSHRAYVMASAQILIGGINEAFEPGSIAFPGRMGVEKRRIFRVREHVHGLRNTRVFCAVETRDAGRKQVSGRNVILGHQVKVGPDERLGDRMTARRPGELAIGPRRGVEVPSEGFTARGLRETLTRRRAKRGVSLCHSDQVQQKVHTTLCPSAIVFRMPLASESLTTGVMCGKTSPPALAANQVAAS